MVGTLREYAQKCKNHVHAAWQAGEVIVTFLFAIGAAVVTYFGLANVPSIPQWLVYAGSALLTVLYFISVIQFQVWRSEARRNELLEGQLTPAIDLDFKPESEGIVKTRTEVHHLIEVDGQQRLAKRDDQAAFVCITVKCLSQKTIPNCAAFITKLEKGTVQGW